MNELEALCHLNSIPNLGSVKIRLLIAHFGSALQALEADRHMLKHLPGFGVKLLENWEEKRSSITAKQILSYCNDFGIEIIPYSSPEYPKRLLDIIDFPILLYIKGTLLKDDERSLSVVGTRQATIYGLEMAKKISFELSKEHFTVVSGLAKGVDAAAHEGALLNSNGRTLAVLGSGLAHIYPEENRALSDAIVKRGALISEFSPFTAPDRHTFPRRNRIVSAISQGTVLIEAPQKSGAMITIEKALSQGRPVFALPGRVDFPTFRGNHYLLKKGSANLIEDGADIAAQFDSLIPDSQRIGTNRSTAESNCYSPNILEAQEKSFYDLLPVHEVSIEEIVSLTKIPVAKVNAFLMGLVLKKQIKAYPGRIYKKISCLL